jgi:hypothetical protein
LVLPIRLIIDASAACDAVAPYGKFGMHTAETRQQVARGAAVSSSLGSVAAALHRELVTPTEDEHYLFFRKPA